MTLPETVNALDSVRKVFVTVRCAGVKRKIALRDPFGERIGAGMGTPTPAQPPAGRNSTTALVVGLYWCFVSTITIFSKTKKYCGNERPYYTVLLTHTFFYYIVKSTCTI